MHLFRNTSEYCLTSFHNYKDREVPHYNYNSSKKEYYLYNHADHACLFLISVANQPLLHFNIIGIEFATGYELILTSTRSDECGGRNRERVFFIKDKVRCLKCFLVKGKALQSLSVIATYIQ